MWRLSSAASSAWQSVKSSGAHVFAAWTIVWLTRSESKPASRSNADHLIVQSQVYRCYWRSQKPITRMQGWCCKNVCLVHVGSQSGGYISASWWSTTGRSHTFCICCDSAGGTVAHDRVVQQIMAWFVSPSGMLKNVDGRMGFWSSSVEAAEAKKAEGVSVTAFMFPSLLYSPVGWLVTTGCPRGERLIFSWVLPWGQSRTCLIAGCRCKVTSLWCTTT